MSKVKVGIVGSRFQADCIASAVKAIPEEAELVAVASPTKGHAAEFAKRHGMPQAFTDYHDLLRDPNVEMVSITAPNRLHAQITINAAKAGKHVVCEKPLCITLEEADAMIDACRRAGVLLLYAEELFFAPARRQASIIASASSSVMHSGFSQTTCLPAFAASVVIWACRRLGAVIEISSTCGSRSRS